MTLQNMLNRRKGISNVTSLPEQAISWLIVGYSENSVTIARRTGLSFGAEGREGKNHIRHIESVDNIKASYGLVLAPNPELISGGWLSLMGIGRHPIKKESAMCLCGLYPAHKQTFCSNVISLPAEGFRVWFKKNVLKTNLN